MTTVFRILSLIRKILRARDHPFLFGFPDNKGYICDVFANSYLENYTNVNHKELLKEMSRRRGYSIAQTTLVMEAMAKVISRELCNSSQISIQGFGSLEVKKTKERISVNPVTRKRVLIPPKLMPTFKAGATFKERIKKNISDE